MSRRLNPRSSGPERQPKRGRHAYDDGRSLEALEQRISQREAAADSADGEEAQRGGPSPPAEAGDPTAGQLGSSNDRAGDQSRHVISPIPGAPTGPDFPAPSVRVPPARVAAPGLTARSQVVSPIPGASAPAPAPEVPPARGPPPPHGHAGEAFILTVPPTAGAGSRGPALGSAIPPPAPAAVAGGDAIPPPAPAVLARGAEAIATEVEDGRPLDGGGGAGGRPIAGNEEAEGDPLTPLQVEEAMTLHLDNGFVCPISQMPFDLPVNFNGATFEQDSIAVFIAREMDRIQGTSYSMKDPFGQEIPSDTATTAVSQEFMGELEAGKRDAIAKFRRGESAVSSTTIEGPNHDMPMAELLANQRETIEASTREAAAILAQPRAPLIDLSAEGGGDVESREQSVFEHTRRPFGTARGGDQRSTDRAAPTAVSAATQRTGDDSMASGSSGGTSSTQERRTSDNVAAVEALVRRNTANAAAAAAVARATDSQSASGRPSVGGHIRPPAGPRGRPAKPSLPDLATTPEGNVISNTILELARRRGYGETLAQDKLRDWVAANFGAWWSTFLRPYRKIRSSVTLANKVRAMLRDLKLEHYTNGHSPDQTGALGEDRSSLGDNIFRYWAWKSANEEDTPSAREQRELRQQVEATRIERHAPLGADTRAPPRSTVRSENPRGNARAGVSANVLAPGQNPSVVGYRNGPGEDGEDAGLDGGAANGAGGGGRSGGRGRGRGAGGASTTRNSVFNFIAESRARVATQIASSFMAPMMSMVHYRDPETVTASLRQHRRDREAAVAAGNEGAVADMDLAIEAAQQELRARGRFYAQQVREESPAENEEDEENAP